MSRDGKRKSKAASKRLVAGVGPVRELIAAAPTSIRRIWVAEGRAKKSDGGGRAHHGRETENARSGDANRGDPVAEIRKCATEEGIAVSLVTHEELTKLLGGRERHQGVVAETRPYRYADIDEMLSLAAKRGEAPLIVAIDGVTDPHNLGAIARSALLLGAHGLVLPRDRAAEVNATVAKTSAGAVEHLLVAQVTNLARALGELKEEGLWIYAVAATPRSKPLAETDLAGPACLLMGSEGYGLRTLVAKQADYEVSIPMCDGPVGSFNVSVAAAIALYEVDRQRRLSGG